jgi:hypothetical protein
MRRPALIALALVALIAAGFVVWKALSPPAPKPIAVKVPPPAPSSVEDPLLPGRAAALDGSRAALDPKWVSAAPLKQFQYSLRAPARGGVEPCAVAVPSAAKAALALSRGYLFTGNQPRLEPDGKFDLIFHLHGDAPVRRELVESGKPFVLYTLTLPPSSSYAPLFAGSGLFNKLIDEIAAAVSKEFGVTAQVRHLAVSAWSAGFEGVRSILYQPEAERIEALLLIDGLHAPRGPNGLTKNMEPFIRFARRAERRERWFTITHSSIPTTGYTSTTESAHFLINALGGRPTAVQRNDGFGLELVDFFSSGKLHVRGYAGNDKADHCAQLLLMRSLFGALHRHFHP